MDNTPLTPSNDDEPTEPVNAPLSFEELDALAEKGELTAESFNQQLQSYADSYRQEFELSSKIDPDNVEEYTRDFFKKNIHAAAAQIVWLSTNADSHSVQLNASKYVIEAAQKDDENAGNPIANLLKSLQKNDSTSPAPAE